MSDVLVRLQREIEDLRAQLRDYQAAQYVTGGAWTSYGATSTITGWSSYTAQSIYYRKVGSIMHVAFNLSGTSDNTATSFTLPTACRAGVTIYNPCRARDNTGTIVAGLIGLLADSSTVTLYPAIGGGAWTASGTKTVQGEFWYPI